MNNPVCAICGHVNRVGAVACEACDRRLDTTADEPYATDAREPFASTGGPSWTASGTSEPGSRLPADDIPAPPFKSAGDVISPMLAVYRKHFMLVGILVLVATVPQALLQYSVIDLINDAAAAVLEGGEPGAAATTTGAGLLNLLIWVVGVLCGALLSGALVYGVVDVQRAGQAAAGECLARGLKALPKVFVVSLLYTLITVFGFVLLIVPGVIFSLMFAVSIPAAVVEGRGPIEALKRSFELTKGYKGLIFITYFLWGLLIAVIGMVIGWSFGNSGLDLLPTLLLQTAVLGMLNSSTHVLTVYIYLGLLREHRSGFSTHAFTPGPEAAVR